MSELLTLELDEPLPLAAGGLLPRQQIAYTTRGRLDANAANAVLVCHPFTHDAHVSGFGPDGRRGWWDAVVGPGKAIDSDRFFVICSNVLGGCGGSTGPASLEPGSGRPYGSRFPLLTIADMVDAQARLLTRLGIKRLAAVVGGCMGAMQALEWGRRHPERVERVVAITISPATSAHSLALWRVMRRLIETDPDFRGGDYYGGPWPKQGLGLSNQVALLLWMGRQQMEERYGRRPAGEQLRFQLGEDFAIEELLERVQQSTAERFDPNTFRYLSRAMDYFDLESGHPSLAAAVAAMKARVLLVSYRGDWRYPPAETERLEAALVEAGVPTQHLLLDSAWSHGAFLYDPLSLLVPLRGFLERPRAL